MRALLDNDVFFAALVLDHPHHAISRRWLDRIKPTGWSIASETYLAAVRLLMNPRVMGSGVLRAATAVRAVETERGGRHPGQVVVAPGRPDAAMLAKAAGHREIMDLWLVQIARDTGHKLATHDQGVRTHWPNETMPVV